MTTNAFNIQSETLSGATTLITTNELAQLLKFRSRKSLDRMRRQGRGPRYVRIGEGARPRIRYRVCDVERFLDGEPDEICNQLQRIDV